MNEKATSDTLHIKENALSPVFKATPKDSSRRILMFLVALFILTTAAVSVMLGLTVRKIHKHDDRGSSDHSDAASIVSTSGGSSVPCQTAKPSQETDVCLTEGCVLAAARLRNNIDMSVNPCDDFYQFACGSWLKKHVIPEDKSVYGTFSELDDNVAIKLKGLLEEENKDDEPSSIHKAKDFYKGCVDTDQIEKSGIDLLLDYIESLGGWPILGSKRGGNWNEAAFNLEDLMVLLRNETNDLPIVDVKIYQDLKHPEKQIITMDQTGFGMPSREYYLVARNDTTLLAYQKMLIDVAIALGADKTTAKHDAEAIVDFERELAHITIPMEERRDMEKLYNKMCVGDLHKNFTGIDWVKLLQGIFGNVNINVDESEDLLVATPSYFQALGDILQKQSSRTLANYLVGHIILSKVSFLPESIRKIDQEYQKAITGSASQTPRWQFCGMHIMFAMQQVVGRLFAAKYFTKEAKDDVAVMITHLRESFKELITELNWMEDTTKTFAREKVDFLEPRIGYPDWIYNDTKLNADYNQVAVHRNEPLRSLISIDRAAVQALLGKLRENYDKSR